MTIETAYNIGDEIAIGGQIHKIVSIHLYESDNKHTERYYFGDGKWITVVREEKHR